MGVFAAFIAKVLITGWYALIVSVAALTVGSQTGWTWWPTWGMLATRAVHAVTAPLQWTMESVAAGEPIKFAMVEFEVWRHHYPFGNVTPWTSAQEDPFFHLNATVRVHLQTQIQVQTACNDLRRFIGNSSTAWCQNSTVPPNSTTCPADEEINWGGDESTANESFGFKRYRSERFSIFWRCVRYTYAVVFWLALIFGLRSYILRFVYYVIVTQIWCFLVFSTHDLLTRHDCWRKGTPHVAQKDPPGLATFVYVLFAMVYTTVELFFTAGAALSSTDVVACWRKYTHTGEAPLTTEGWSRTGGALPNAEPKTLTELHDYAREQALHADLTNSSAAVDWAKQAWDNIATIAVNEKRLAGEVLFVHLVRKNSSMKQNDKLLTQFKCQRTMASLWGMFGSVDCVTVWDSVDKQVEFTPLQFATLKVLTTKAEYTTAFNIATSAQLKNVSKASNDKETTAASSSQIVALSGEVQELKVAIAKSAKDMATLLAAVTAIPQQQQQQQRQQQTQQQQQQQQQQQPQQQQQQQVPSQSQGALFQAPKGQGQKKH